MVCGFAEQSAAHVQQSSTGIGSCAAEQYWDRLMCGGVQYWDRRRKPAYAISVPHAARRHTLSQYQYRTRAGRQRMTRCTCTAYAVQGAPAQRMLCRPTADGKVHLVHAELFSSLLVAQ
eukprot:152456-Rhodomonas_salina.5